MIFIDKAKGERDAETILQNFMSLHQLRDDNGQTEDGRYENISYEALDDTAMTIEGVTATHRNHLIRVIRSIQADDYGVQRCCYCMRNINDEDITLEHVMQYSLDQNKRDEYQRYISYGLPFLTAGNVILSCDYVAKFDTANQAVPPYPHVMSYHNLVASCMGYFPKKQNRSQQMVVCCNNKRKDAHIYPLYFDVDWENKMFYGRSGKMILVYRGGDQNVKSGLINFLTKVGLNAEALVEIRRLWFLMRKEDIAVIRSLKTKAQRGAKIAVLLLTTNDETLPTDNLLRKKYCIDDYWTLFLKYDWFWRYYHKKYDV